MKEAYLGVDCGSASVKGVILDKNNTILESVYLKNEGIMESLKKVFTKINVGNYKILGCGVTGSGRNFVKVLLNADLTKSEVLAHSIATLTYYPNVNTIFEIGGEDCKLMTLNNGIITDFKMNNICGGGTGTMIVAIAARMGLEVDEIGDCALRSNLDIDLPGKCGIFCQSAVINKLNSGFKKEDILMGVCRALIRNYLAICRGAPLKPPYVFQGETAKNKALVKALEEELGHKVTIPDKCGLMGAIGMAMIVKEEKIANSNFIKIDMQTNLETKGFKCSDCENRCEVTQIYRDYKFIGSVGSRCGKWETREHLKKELAPKLG